MGQRNFPFPLKVRQSFTLALAYTICRHIIYNVIVCHLQPAVPDYLNRLVIYADLSVILKMFALSANFRIVLPISFSESLTVCRLNDK